MSYQKPKHYTAKELHDAKLADLCTEIYCAKRDGLIEYAKECEIVYAKLQNKG